MKPLKHEREFRPSNPGKKGIVYGCLEPFPEYKEDPPKELKRKPKPEVKKEAFKPNHGGNLTRPTPTISCNPMNIRKLMAWYNIYHYSFMLLIYYCRRLSNFGFIF